MILLAPLHLRRLGLSEQAEELEKHERRVLLQIERMAEAHEVAVEVDNWCSEVLGLSAVTPMVELQGRARALRNFRDRVNTLRRTLDLQILDQARERIGESGKHLDDLQKRHAKRLDALWNMELKVEEDIADAQREVESLLGILEGCDSDAEDLLVMRRILAIYAADFPLLSDMSLTDEALSGKLADLSEARDGEWSEDDEHPWPIPETYSAFGKTIQAARKARAYEWLEDALIPLSEVPQLETRAANQLLTKARTPPPFLSSNQAKQVAALSQAIERHLLTREVDWLLERFRQLPADSRKQFLKAAQELQKG